MGSSKTASDYLSVIVSVSVSCTLSLHVYLPLPFYFCLSVCFFVSLSVSRHSLSVTTYLFWPSCMPRLSLCLVSSSVPLSPFLCLSSQCESPCFSVVDSPCVFHCDCFLTSLSFIPSLAVSSASLYISFKLFLLFSVFLSLSPSFS